MPPAARKRSTTKRAQPAKRATQPAKVARPAATATAPTATGRSAPAAAASLTLPFVSASVALPEPGAAVKVGPLAITMPTGYLYYAGLGALAVVGTIEWPVAAALGAGGFVVKRIRNRTTSQSGRARSSKAT